MFTYIERLATLNRICCFPEQERNPHWFLLIGITHLSRITRFTVEFISTQV